LDIFNFAVCPTENAAATTSATTRDWTIFVIGPDKHWFHVPWLGHYPQHIFNLSIARFACQMLLLSMRLFFNLGIAWITSLLLLSMVMLVLLWGWGTNSLFWFPEVQPHIDAYTKCKQHTSHS
jgi:hypothetical protein